MNKNSVLCNFLNKHKDNWKELLEAEPYLLNIKEPNEEGYDNLRIFKYNQCGSDFAIPEVQEARGIIINIETLEVVCWPFRKFANFGESYADDIDWATARVTEKIDGSIMKLWYNKPVEKWELSSNSCFNAYREMASCIGSCVTSSVSLGKLFESAAVSLDKSILDKDKTYIFELCSPDNVVVVQHEAPKIYHIGTRHNITGKESNDDIGIEKPKEFKLNSLEACKAFADAEGPDAIDSKVYKEHIEFEGLVVNDANYNRVKIKSWKYVAMSHFICGISPYDVVSIILKNETEEFLTYFPQYRDTFELLSQRLEALSKRIQAAMDRGLEEFEKRGRDRKAFAAYWISSQEKDDRVWGFNAVDGDTLDEILYYMHHIKNGLVCRLIEEK